MREIKSPQSEPKCRLLNAAEQLFAERGFDAVSLRDVTQLGKINIAAVNYHFGSRDGLIAWVVTRYATPIHEERILRLDLLERKWSGKVVPIEELLDAFVRPLVGIASRSDLSERLLYQLLGRIFALRVEDLPSAVADQAMNSSDRFMRAFSKSLPTVSQEEQAWRIHFMVGAMIHMLMNQEMLHRMTNGSSGSPTMETTVSRFIRFTAAGMREGLELELAEEKGPQALFDF